MGKKGQRVKIVPLRMVVVNGKEEIGKMMFHIVKKVFFSSQSNVLVARDKETDGEREKLRRWRMADKAFPSRKKWN